jgi:hypothetical protein
MTAAVGCPQPARHVRLSTLEHLLMTCARQLPTLRNLAGDVQQSERIGSRACCRRTIGDRCLSPFMEVVRV